MAALPASAQAVTVSPFGGDLLIEDTANVSDKLEIGGSRQAGYTVRSTDGRPVTAGQGCTQTNATTVTCGGDEVFVLLAGGADVLTDRSDLAGGINMGDGNDTVTDLNRAALGSTNTTFEGGPGSDTVSYRGRPEAVTVTLDDLTGDGAAGEVDNVRSDVEKLIGGNGADRLTGSAGDNLLFGQRGNDTLRGGAGNDGLVGGPDNDTEFGGPGDDTLGAQSRESTFPDDIGTDRLIGEEGDDLLRTHDGIADSLIDCGGQAADRAVIDLVDPEPTGCTQVERAQKAQHPTVQVRGGVLEVRGGQVAVRLSCPRGAPGRRCVGVVEIRKGRRLVSSARYRLRAGRRRTVRLPVGRVRGRAEVRTRERDTRGRPETTRTKVLLRD